MTVTTKKKPIPESPTWMAQQIAHAAIAFEKGRTGHAPKKVTVVLNDNTLVITFHGVLSAAEKDLAKTSAGALLIQEYHSQLFKNSAFFRHEIKRITGAEVRDGAADIVTTSGAVVKAFTTGTVVQFYLLARALPAAIWSERVTGDPLTFETLAHA